jgi:hypothetical protein
MTDSAQIRGVLISRKKIISVKTNQSVISPAQNAIQSVKSLHAAAAAALPQRQQQGVRARRRVRLLQRAPHGMEMGSDGQ